MKLDVLIPTVVSAVLLASPSCCPPPTPVIEAPAPVYNRVLLTEPDWRRYSPGDRACIGSVHAAPAGEIKPVQWYVVRGTDPTPPIPPASAIPWACDWYVSANHTLFGAP